MPAKLVPTLAILLLLGGAQSARAEDWPMFHLDSTNAGARGAAPLPADFAGWTVQGDIAPAWYGGPIVIDGTVYQVATSAYAYEASTGSLKWTRQDRGSVFSPAFADGRLFGVMKDLAYALDAKTGKDLWLANLSQGVTSNPVVTNGTVYAVAQQDLFALDAMTGQMKWKTTLEGTDAPRGIIAQEGTILVPSWTGSVYGVDADGGRILWARPKVVDAFGSAGVAPTAIQGTLFIAGLGPFDQEKKTFNATMTALDIATGRELWAFGTPTNSTGVPVASDGRVFVYCHDKNFCGLDAATGSLLWSTHCGSDGSAGPVVADGVVYVDCVGKIRAFDAATGKVLRNVGYDGVWVDGTPAYTNGVLFLQVHIVDHQIDNEGHVRAWNLTAMPVGRIQSQPPAVKNPIPGAAETVFLLGIATLAVLKRSSARSNQSLPMRDNIPPLASTQENHQ